MTRDEYVRQVEAVLVERTAKAARQLAATLVLVPPQTHAAEINIFVDQDGEGFLGVRVNLIGPDVFVLNRAIAAHAGLLTTRMSESGLEPPLPLMTSRGGSFSVHDVLTDCAAAWIGAVWRKTERPIRFHLPVTVVSPDGYGTTVPFGLSHETRDA